MTNQSKLDHRIATAEGSYQAERYRRERVEKKLDKLRTTNASLQAAIQDIELRYEARGAVIAQAPHAPECASNDWGDDNEPTEARSCNCWKADAL